LKKELIQENKDNHTARIASMLIKIAQKINKKIMSRIRKRQATTTVRHLNPHYKSPNKNYNDNNKN
jgi:hypothetical protein